MSQPDDAPRPGASPWQKPGAAQSEAIRKRQRSRSIVMALLLGAFVVLMFGISIAKIKAGMAH
ncbi:MAG: hypothetical protein ABI810_14355 [Sphingomonas bacterium]